MMVIIDPGHGGADPGGGSNGYWLEKDKNLQISLYQLARFKELGVDAEITRTTDKYIGPSKRAKMVKNSGAEICISNHINAGGSDGAETIHSIYSDGILANVIAKGLEDVGQNVRRVFDRTYPGDEEEDYYYMHRNTGNVETVIVEYGFADSTGDDISQLNNDWKILAESVIKSTCSYLVIPYNDGQPKGSYDIDGGPSIPAIIVDGHLYAPIRKVAESLGAEVTDYDNNRKHASISLKGG